MNNNISKLTQGHLLVSNVMHSFLGQGLPLLAAFFSIPLIVTELGVDKFGILTLAWMLTGYFSLFDIGIARALTKIVAEKLGGGHMQEIPALFWSGMLLMLMMGIFGALLLSAISPYLLREVLKISLELQSEILDVLYLLAFSIPIIISSASLRGVLEAYQRFDLINYVRVPIGTSTFLGPLLVIQFSKSIFYIIASLVAIRLVEFLVTMIICLYIIPSLRYCIFVQRSLMKDLMRFGGWMTVSNIAGPLITYSDRFLLSSIVPIATLAYYTLPYEMVIRLMIIPGALAGVFFPAFSISFEQDRKRAVLMFHRGVKYTFIFLFPIILIIVILAREALDLWLGIDFGQNSTCILQWLAVGALFSSQSYIPFALVHAAGRPDLTAKLHFIEAPFYFLLIWWLITAYGIEGAAIGWAVRSAVDALILFGMAQRLLLIGLSIKFMASAIVATLFILIPVMFPIAMVFKGPFLFLTLLAFLVIGWLLILDSEERFFLRNYLKDKMLSTSKDELP